MHEHDIKLTEKINPASINIDRMSTLDMVRVINDEDKKVAIAVESQLPQIAQAIDLVSEALSNGGRLIYCGCGTSGRLGILDASECPPTYGVDPGLVIGIIAGGVEAVFRSVEGAEDDETRCERDLKDIQFSNKDVLVGIAASGGTPYVAGGMRYASGIGAKTVSVCCNKNSLLPKLADIAITPEVGSEIVTGSTRMKSGTAQKMVLNMLSTGAMIRLGKVYGNLMVDVQPKNAKLVKRAYRIIAEATGCGLEMAKQAFEQSGKNVKTAIVMVSLNVSKEEANAKLAEHGGIIARVINP